MPFVNHSKLKLSNGSAFHEYGYFGIYYESNSAAFYWSKSLNVTLLPKFDEQVGLQISIQVLLKSTAVHFVHILLKCTLYE